MDTIFYERAREGRWMNTMNIDVNVSGRSHTAHDQSINKEETNWTCPITSPRDCEDLSVPL